MKIALTGCSGSVGSAITALALHAGHRIVGIDRVAPAKPHDALEFIEGEMENYDLLVRAFAGCDALIHMAAIPSPGHHPDHVVHNNNVVGSYNALRAAVECGITRICQASSVNAIGHAYSRVPHYDYFPIDEEHPNYAEDPYSLSKWICEQQADAFARRHENLSIASLRFHWVLPSREVAIERYKNRTDVNKHLWAWVHANAAARACLLGVEPGFRGHEVFYIVGPETVSDTPSLELAARYFPDVPIRGDLSGHRSFFSSTKAERLLGWRHDDDAPPVSRN